MIKLLVSKGANTETLTMFRQTTLHLAVALRMDLFDGIMLLHLLIDYGASMEAMDGDGRTPFHIAIQTDADCAAIPIHIAILKDEYSETVTYSPS